MWAVDNNEPRANGNESWESCAVTSLEGWCDYCARVVRNRFAERRVACSQNEAAALSFYPLRYLPYIVLFVISVRHSPSPLRRYPKSSFPKLCCSQDWSGPAVCERTPSHEINSNRVFDCKLQVLLAQSRGINWLVTTTWRPRWNTMIIWMVSLCLTS
jgi:hypothetical protein